MQTIAEQVHKVTDQLEKEINEHGFCNLIFKFRDGKFYTFEKQLTINESELRAVIMK